MFGVNRFYGVVAFVSLLFLSACDNAPQQGPATVKWDRDVCERCGMLLSDRKYAAQYRDAKGKAYLFDDPGEMLLTFHEQYKGDNKLPIYVTDATTGKWLDARTASYSDGHLTPMGYGYGAHAESGPGRIDFATLLKLLIAGEKGAPRPTGAMTHDSAQSHQAPHSQH